MSKKIEFIYTPTHGSWLNMVEIELSVLVRQCLKRRVADTQTLEREAGAWCEERNRLGTSVHLRRFTTKMLAASCASSIHQSILDGGLEGKFCELRL
jgi:DDE superfamily endonuclease